MCCVHMHYLRNSIHLYRTYMSIIWVSVNGCSSMSVSCPCLTFPWTPHNIYKELLYRITLTQNSQSKWSNVAICIFAAKINIDQLKHQAENHQDWLRPFKTKNIKLQSSMNSLRACSLATLLRNEPSFLGCSHSSRLRGTRNGCCNHGLVGEILYGPIYDRICYRLEAISKPRKPRIA